MKRMLSVLLVLLLIFILAGCGSKTSTNSPPINENNDSEQYNENDQYDDTHVHNYSKATCTQAAKCFCGETSGSALGHNYSGEYCTRCGASNPNYKENTQSNSNHTHYYSSRVTTEATCAKEGVRTYTCSCGNSYTEKISKTTDHDWEYATCTKPKTCKDCGKTEGSAEEHNYKEGICTVCNAVHEQKYVDAQIDAAEKAFKDHTKYNDALKIIKVALQKFPQNNTLKTKRDYYQSFAPLYLSDVEPYAKSYWFKRCDSDTDVFKTTHNHCIRIEKNFTSADGTYDLSAKYNTFKATIYGLGDGNLGSLKIYADGVCVYSNTSISVNTRPIEIQLDITGVMDLKFEMKQDYNSYIGECFGLSNVYVQKTKK